MFVKIAEYEKYKLKKIDKNQSIWYNILRSKTEIVLTHDFCFTM